MQSTLVHCATYHDRVLELPSSVRVALWVTDAWRRGEPLSAALAAALPDVDHLDGDVERLGLWGDLGERAVLVALPAPGDLHGMPRGGADGIHAAVDAGECLVAPALGGILVPEVSTFGSGTGADSGTRLDLCAYDADPVPQHLVTSLDGSSLERHLREQILGSSEALQDVGGQPFAGRMARELADASLDGDWRLPDDLPPRLHRVLRLAGTVSAVTGVALAMPDDALDASTSGQRDVLLRQLKRGAERILADATNACCAAIAGWLPSVR